MDDITRSKGLLEFWEDSQLAGHNAAYLEDLYERYLTDPANVPEHWRTFFQTLPRVNGHGAEPSHATIRETFRAMTRQPFSAHRAEPCRPGESAHEEKQIRVLQLINAYRFRAHQIADIDPLGLREKPDLSELKPEFHGLDESDLNTQFDTGSLAIGGRATLRDIVAKLREIYCGSVGAEYMHITETQEKRWIQVGGRRWKPRHGCIFCNV